MLSYEYFVLLICTEKYSKYLNQYFWGYEKSKISNDQEKLCYATGLRLRHTVPSGIVYMQ
jgi:hypothetical protein